ncbi:MAG: NAD(P)H-hydrate epimerase [Planctomycetota bacterium]
MSEDRLLNDTPEAPVRLTRRQSRAVDRYAIETLGIPGVVLMENAGINAAGAVFDVLREAFEFEVDEENARIAVVCGGGNNGGDGYVVARQLKCWGMSPVVYAVKRPEDLVGDARVMADAWVSCGGQIVPASEAENVERHAEQWEAAHVVVDALLGTGYGAEKGGLRGVTAAAVRAMSRLVGGDLEADGGLKGGFRGRVVALDVPSGMDADTGKVAGGDGGEAVRADLTVTFVAEKAGFGEKVAGEWLGRVVTADIGLPWSVVEAAIAGESAGNEGTSGRVAGEAFRSASGRTSGGGA